MRTKVLSVILSLCMIFTIMPITTFAADQTELDISQGNIVITDDGVNIDGVATYAKNANGYIITQTDPETATSNTITVSATTAHITIKDINIEAGDECAAFSISPTSTVELTISGSNTLKGGANYAGLWVPTGASVTIQSTNGGTTDSLTATGGNYAAGIGGSDRDTVNDSGATCGTVSIKSGTINAKGGRLAAGIGGGYGGDGGNITISAETGGSATVTASGDNNAAGIGGGYSGNGGNITISAEEDCLTTVTAKGGSNGGAGIGGGRNGDGVNGDGGNITISAKEGGSTTVTATGGNLGAGIGGGYNGNGEEITISAETGGSTAVTATGGENGAGIGGGYGEYGGGDSGNIIISAEEGGSTTVTATGGDGGAGIGSGYEGDCGTIEITGSTVVAKGNNVGIGGYSYTGSIDISNSTIIATGSFSAIYAAEVNFDYSVDYIWRIGANDDFTKSTTPYSWRASHAYLEIQIPLLGIALTPTLSLVVGETEKLAVTFTPGSASDKTITWTTADESVATVDESGEVKAIGKGMAIIYATTANGETATCTVTVAEVGVASVTLDKSTLVLNVGETDTIKVTFHPENATHKTVTWTSSDTSVATVESGTITAVKGGVATITATTASGISATCVVTVIVPVTGIELDMTALALNVGDSEVLTATITPSTASDKTIVWSSSDTSVATVENGTITAVNGGEATITATAANGKTATCVVTVTVPVTGIELDMTTLALNVGDTDTLTVTFTPENATNKTIIWTSSNEAVATVDENGQVVAVGVGEAIITATSGDMTATCEITVTEPTPEETNGITGFLRMIKMILELIIYVFGLFAG